MPSKFWTVSEAAALTGATPRAIQFLADRGVLHAQVETHQAGRGVHRRFARNELVIAAIAQAFARRRISIGEILRITTAVRTLAEMSERETEEWPDYSRKYLDGGPVYLVVNWWTDQSEGEKIFVHRITGDDPKLEHKHFDALGRANGFASAICLNDYLSKIP